MESIGKTSKSTDPQFWRNLAEKHFIAQGKSELTAKTYSRELGILTKYYKKPLNQLTEDEIRDYIYYRRVERKLSATSMRILYCGLKCLYEDILEVNLPLLDKLKPQKEFKLLQVLSRREVLKILENTLSFHNYAFFRTVYTCGLRLAEALNLTIHDINGERKLLKILGKGNKERYVPLPDATYQLLRSYWATHRNPKLIFPALGRNRKQASISTIPMERISVQGSLKRAAELAGVNTKGVRMHILRHSYATHLLESGVSIKAVQKNLGHATLRTTMRYLHLTNFHETNSINIINSMMNETQLIMPKFAPHRGGQNV